jgi:hypothetical protein
MSFRILWNSVGFVMWKFDVKWLDGVLSVDCEQDEGEGVVESLAFSFEGACLFSHLLGVARRAIDRWYNWVEEYVAGDTVVWSYGSVVVGWVAGLDRIEVQFDGKLFVMDRQGMVSLCSVMEGVLRGNGDVRRDFGRLWDLEMELRVKHPCSACRGLGISFGHLCDVCGGRGYACVAK